jgi:hypothetical protein
MPNRGKNAGFSVELLFVLEAGEEVLLHCNTNAQQIIFGEVHRTSGAELVQVPDDVSAA